MASTHGDVAGQALDPALTHGARTVCKPTDSGAVEEGLDGAGSPSAGGSLSLAFPAAAAAPVDEAGATVSQVEAAETPATLPAVAAAPAATEPTVEA
eukprot:8191452-Alexandrium_andersonii.AAC.1